MDRDKQLQEIFGNDPLGLLDIKPTGSPVRNEGERLIASFQAINEFYEQNQREPEQGGGIQEHQLYSRLRSLRENASKKEVLIGYDKYGLLSLQQNQINSFNDVLADDVLGLLDDDSEGLFELKHVPQYDERASADFVARRKPCKDFDKYETLFKAVQRDLSSGKRSFIPFKEENLKAGEFYVHNGILLFLEKVDFVELLQPFKSGSRVRSDGRTRVIFENGTESNMLYRSLYKELLANGIGVSENVDTVNKQFVEKFSNINEEDKGTGRIYVLKSTSDKPEIRQIQHLYKIGYSSVTVEERTRRANQEPTYLMSDVRVVMSYDRYNMNPQKLEQLLQRFFGSSCLSIDVFDNEGNRHSPREWFVVPLPIIHEAIQLIISGEIVDYRYDSDGEQILRK